MWSYHGWNFSGILNGGMLPPWELDVGDRTRQNGHHLIDSIFKCIFLIEIIWISIKISLKFDLKGPVDIPTLAQIMAWRRTGYPVSSIPDKIFDMLYNMPFNVFVRRCDNHEYSFDSSKTQIAFNPVKPFQKVIHYWFLKCSGIYVPRAKLSKDSPTTMNNKKDPNLAKFHLYYYRVGNVLCQSITNHVTDFLFCTSPSALGQQTSPEPVSITIITWHFRFHPWMLVIST